MKPLATVVAALALLALSAGPAAAADCGNYGFPRGHQGNNPVFTQKQIFGAGVFDIRQSTLLDQIESELIGLTSELTIAT